ncbi:MAG: helix-turn-helix transcriptional regulator [Spirochaetales bacterium]|nr:helix-turn-helix transcriptional regulator [Spirochaetales bacterium]
MLEPALPKTSRTDIQASDNAPTESANGQPKLSLSQREHQVLRLIVEGKRYKEIAAALDISMPTVKSHVSSAYRKLGVKGRADLYRRSLLQ